MVTTAAPGTLFARLRDRLIPKTLATRLALTYTALVLIIMSLLAWALAQTVRETYLNQLERDLAGETAAAELLLSPLLDSGGDPRVLQAMVARLAEALPARLTVVERDGSVLADSAAEPATMDNHANRPEIQAALRTGIGSSSRHSATLDDDYFYVARRTANDPPTVIRVGVPLDVIGELTWALQQRIALTAIFAAILMTGAGWFVARRIGEALDAMRGQAAAVAAGRFDVAVEPAPTKELGDLGRAFNAMTGQLRETLAELERVRVRLEATLANLSDGVIISDDRGHVVLANRAALDMLAVRGTVLGQPLVEVARDHELSGLVNRVLTAADPAAATVVRHGRSGKILQAAARRLAAAEERIALLVLRDVTELRRLEGMRRDFVANVSHELRTPLTSIRALVETLEAGAIDDPAVSTDFLARIVAEVDRLALLVDELLDLARLESGRLRLSLEPVDPESVLRGAVERMMPQIERSGLTVEIELAQGAGSVVADRARIDQVLLNLVDNAIKFTPGGGTVTLTAVPAGAAVEFRVRDTGIGVNPEDLPRLFERFYKADRARRSRGTGLGLAIAKHIVLAHEGTIWAEANLDRGTTIAFTLPTAGPTRDTTEEPAGEPSLASAGARVEGVLEPITQNVEGEDGQRQR